MKVIIPLAGKGTRLRPHTYVVPKPMLKVAGKPVMEYILDDLRALGTVEQIIYITGHLKEKVEAFARSFEFPSVFVEQKEQRGTADAVALARPYVDQPVLIIFVDTIFDADLSIVKATTADGIIWAHTDRYVGKILHIRAGHALSVQYHNRKDETIYLLSGEMIYRVKDGDELRDVGLKVGESFRCLPCTVHQMEAITDCDVLEASTPDLDDVVRLSDRYGREGTSAP